MEKVYQEVSILLQRIISADFGYRMRSRFASKEQWAEEEPHIKKVMAIDWYVAKEMISDNRKELDKYVKSLEKDKSVENYNAACRAIDKEIDYMFEQVLLGVNGEETN